MQPRDVRVAFYDFWAGFRPAEFQQRFPCIGRKWRLVPDQKRPDLIIYSVFPATGWFNRLPKRGKGGPPRLFLTGENVEPDMQACDFAISFSRTLQGPNHIRIPNWVHRMHMAGLDPKSLLLSQRQVPAEGDRFCAFVQRHPVPVREAFFRTLAARQPIDAPGRSMHNMSAPVGSVAEKLRFTSQYRFAIAFENVASAGYTTEKLPEALCAGTIPLYWGDPLVGLDFNKGAFLDLADFSSGDELADAVMALDADPAARKRVREQPVYADDHLPECAQDEPIFDFWDRVLTSASS
ncbi:MAG TPA: glycosyltransferase family 10 [Caulobacteraceae bacterium]|nr:glycosyltransferase family 10 [Caulobacteraceae bacterium]